MAKVDLAGRFIRDHGGRRRHESNKKGWHAEPKWNQSNAEHQELSYPPEETLPANIPNHNYEYCYLRHSRFLIGLTATSDKRLSEASMAKLGKLFGERVRSLRSSRGLTQVQLADIAQVSEEWVRRIERGEASPSFDTIEALATALDALPVELFSTEAGRGPDERLAAAAATLPEEAIEWLIAGARLLKERGRST